MVNSEGLQSETERPVLMLEVKGTSQQVTKGSQVHGAGGFSRIPRSMKHTRIT